MWDLVWRVGRSEPAVTPLGLAVGAGAVLMIGAGCVAAAIPADVPGWRFAIVAAAVAGFAAICVDLVAVSVVVGLGFLVSDGFLENRFGELSWHGANDLWRLAILVVVAAWGVGAGEGYRFVRWRSRGLRDIAPTDEASRV